MDSLYSRYANALFSIALEENKVEFYKNEIKMLKQVILQNDEILHLLSSCFIQKEDKEKIIDEVFKNQDINIINFLKVIVNKKQVEEIEKALKVRLNCEVELVNLIDERLLGGVKVVIEDKIFDGSIKNKLEKLKSSLISGGN